MIETRYINMSEGFKAEPSYIGGILVWKIISLKDHSVLAEGPTVNEAINNIVSDFYDEEAREEVCE